MTRDISLLYVEDESDILEHTSFVFRRFFKTVYTASDGEKALEIYHTLKPDLIVLDINIPKKSGLEVAQEIREKDTKIPILIISAYNEEYHLQKAKDLGVNHYLRKPFTLQELRDAIEMF